MNQSTKPTQSRFDAHCHVISREVLFNRLLILFIDATKDYDFKKLINSDLKQEENEGDDKLDVKELLRLLLKNKSGIETFEDLKDDYEKLDETIQGYIVLMVDFEYLFKSKYDVNEDSEEHLEGQKGLAKEIVKEIKERREKIKAALKELKEDLRHEAIELMNSWLKHTEDKHDHTDDSVIDEYLKMGDSSYERQLNTFKELKGAYKENFQAFLAVDPRRPDMMEEILDNVGDGKTFTGLKLYPPMGYSPTDPFLFGKNEGDDCVYKYCIDNEIPIVAHCSSGGFCNLVHSLEVIGAVMPDMSFDSKPVNYAEISEIKFEKRLIKDGFSEMVQEKAYRLNHPKLWEIVLERYPKLKIDLAHFGGDPDVYGNERRDYIFKLISKKDDNGLPKYPNLYSDLSCITEPELLKRIYNDYYLKYPDKFMYGSDYFLNLIFGTDFKTYYSSFKDTFNSSFDKISIENVVRFLFKEDVEIPFEDIV